MLPWESHVDLDPTIVRALLTRQFPDLALTSVRYLAQGWDSQVFEVNGTWVFRFPKRASVVPFLLREIELLPELAHHLPLAIPRFEFVGSAEAESISLSGESGTRNTAPYPFPFVGYRKIEGTFGEDLRTDGLGSRVPLQMGEFLSALHGFPVVRALEVGIPLSERCDPLPGRTEALRWLASIAEAIPDALRRRTVRYLDLVDPLDLAPSRTVLLHQDLAAEHVVLRDGRDGVAGVIDWGDLSLGDPAYDFAGLRWWGGHAMVHEALGAYGHRIDRGFVERTRFRVICAAIEHVHDAMKYHEPELLRKGIEHLEAELQETSVGEIGRS